MMTPIERDVLVHLFHTRAHLTAPEVVSDLRVWGRSVVYAVLRRADRAGLVKSDQRRPMGFGLTPGGYVMAEGLAMLEES